MSTETTLASVCSLIVDCEHKTAPAATPGTEYAYSIGTPNIRNGRIAFGSAKRVDQSTYQAWTARAVPVEGDIILTREAPVGEAALVDGSERVCLGQRTVLLRPNPSIINPRYLHYRLIAPESQERMRSKAEGSTVPHLNMGDIRRLHIDNLPSLHEQAAIANTLGALDDKIAVNDRIATTYESLLRLEFDQLEIDKESNPGERVPASAVIEFNPSRRVVAGSESVYVDMAALPTTSARVKEWTRRPAKSGARFMNGDTLLARITPCLENGKTAYVDFLDENEIGTGSTEFIVMRSRTPYPIHLSYFLARSPRFRAHAIQNMVGSSGRQRVAAKALEDFPLQVPTMEALRGFDIKARNAFSHMKSLDSESQVLTDLRDTLLPKLMSGEIRVRDAEKVVEDAV